MVVDDGRGHRVIHATRVGDVGLRVVFVFFGGNISLLRSKCYDSLYLKLHNERTF